MRGKFIGKTSMGFINGEIYNIRSKVERVTRYGVPMLCISIYDKDSIAWCPYATLEGLLKNWEFLKEEN